MINALLDQIVESTVKKKKYIYIGESYKNNKFKISAPTSTDQLHSVSDIQDHFDYIIKKHEKVTDNPPIWIYACKVENRITFNVKAGYCFKLLMPEITKLEITEVVLDQCNIVNRDYRHDSSFLHTFIPNNNVSIFKTSNSECSYIEVWFTDQNYKPLEIEYKINITLTISWCLTYQRWLVIQLNLEMEYL